MVEGGRFAAGRRPPLVPVGTTFAPLGSVSLDFRVTAFPYKSSSLATPLKRWDYGRSALCYMVQEVSVKVFILPPA